MIGGKMLIWNQTWGIYSTHASIIKSVYGAILYTFRNRAFDWPRIATANIFAQIWFLLSYGSCQNDILTLTNRFPLTSTTALQCWVFFSNINSSRPYGAYEVRDPELFFKIWLLNETPCMWNRQWNRLFLAVFRT